MAPLKNFYGTKTWIIGGSAGIGRSLAENIAKEGGTVAVSSRDAKAISDLVSSLPGNGHLSLPLDVRDNIEVSSAKDRLIAAWGNIDVVIFAAGIYTPMRAFEINLEEAKRIFDINFIGALNSANSVIPHFVSRHSGTLVVISSVAGYRGLPNSLVYGASKAALSNFTETLYLDLKPRGINVHLVCPGFVKTRLTDQNEFKMPALITPQVAAEKIIEGIKKGEFDIHFPKRFTKVMKLLRILPYKLYFYFARKFTGL